MQQLDQQHAGIILQLLSRIKSRKLLDITLPDRLPLRLQHWGPVATREGQGFIFGMGLLIDEDIERYETRMTFIVIDERKTGPQGSVRVFPMHFQDESHHVLWIGVAILRGQIRKYHDHIQKKLGIPAGNWLTLLERMGYV
jgi:hypothetical protein